jgi:ABC-type branched-subunit amino acid transport system substrate-binding protein
MRKIAESTLLVSAAFTILTLVATATTGFSETKEPVSTLAPFKIGFVLPLTGVAADYGLAIRNSVELAKRDRPELFGNINFFFEDVSYDPRVAVTGFNRLTSTEKVDLAVTWGVSFCKALAPIAESRKQPLVGICLDPKVAQGKRYVLRFKNPITDIMRVQAEDLERREARKIGILLSEHPYLEEAYQALELKLQPRQTLEVIERFPNSEMDFRTRIARLEKEKKYDSIGVFLFAGQISTF